MAPSQVTIVVLVRDQLEISRRCLESLLDTDGHPSLVVVDNGSGAEVAGYLDALASREPRVRLLRNERDPGPAEARNQGAALALTDLVCFCDNDVLADDPAWLVPLAAVFERRPGLVAAAPLLLFPSGASGEDTLIQSAGGGVSARGHIGLLGRGAWDAPGFATDRDLAWAPTATLAVRREGFEGAGGFDECFDPVAICEDLDLCCRLRAGGGSIARVGRSRLRHWEGTTFGGLGHDKLAHWRRHLAVIRRRWPEVLAQEPLDRDDELSWTPVVKDYADLDRPRVRPATAAEAASEDLSFFASTPPVVTGGDSQDPDPVPIRIGVIGCGEVALRGALPGFAPPGSALTEQAAPFLDFGGVEGVRTIAVADPDAAARTRAAALCGALVDEADGEHMLDVVPLEGVAVCAPTQHLAGLAIAAIERDVAVLVEKPAASSVAELERLLATRRGRPELACVVNLPWSHHPALLGARDRIDRGEVGAPHRAAVLFEHSGPEAWSSRSSWQRAGGAGIVRDLGPHVADALRVLLGSCPERLIPAGSDRDPDRTRATGAVGAVRVEAEIGWDAPAPRFLVEVEGDRGAINVELIPWAVAAAGKPAAGGGTYRTFVRAVRDGVPAPTDLDTVVVSLRTALDWAAEWEAGGDS